MYVRATRVSAGRSVVAGAFVLAFALYDSVAVQPVLAQTLGRPNVIVDETVLDQLGPPPQSLPDVLLQQQPQAYQPAPRGAEASAMPVQPSTSTGQLLPPPSAMPHSRVMLPRALQPVKPAQPAPTRPQVARVPKPSAKPVTPVEAEPLASQSAPAVVPAEITPPPAATIPDTPKIAPPPAPQSSTPAIEAPSPKAAIAEPLEPPVANAEMPAAPPPPAPLPTVEPPAPPVAATPAPPEPEKPSVAVVPPPPPAPALPPAPKVETPIAETPPAPKPVRPAPRPLAAAQPEPDAKTGSASETAPEKTRTQVAALPSASVPAEVLDGGQTYRIPFGTESSDIPDDGKKYLDELAQRMKSDSALRLQLLGYAGSMQDSASKARRTSLFRALSVRTYLMKQGIRSTRMDVRALGNLVEDGAPDRVDAVVRK